MAKTDPSFEDLGKHVELKLRGSGEKVGEGTVTYANAGKVQIQKTDGTYHQYSTYDVDVHEKKN